MKRKIITTLSLLVAMLLFFGQHMQAQAQAFYTETFPNQAAFNAWTRGGNNQGPAVWRWSNNTNGLFTGQPSFAATTAANGFAEFNSDANGEFPHDVHLTSPVINCTGRNQVFVRFENQYAYFSGGDVSIAEVGVSINGGNYNYRRVLQNVSPNDLRAAVQVAIVELPEAANQANVRIRFRWRGFYEYAWRIDDIGIFDSNPLPANDLALDLPLIPTNFATPITQVDSIIFGCRIQNVGAQAQTNVRARVEVRRNNLLVFSDTKTIGTLQPGVNDTVFFDKAYLPSEINNYTFLYSVTQDATDANPANNSLEGEFVVTQELFAKDDGDIESATQPGEVAGEFWEIGNLYRIVNTGTEAYAIEFSIASNDNAHHGESVTVLLYRVKPDNNPNFTDDDLEIVGFGTYDFTNEPNFGLFTADLIPLEGTGLEPGIRLEPGEYFLTVQYNAEMFMPYSALSYHYDFATVVKNGSWFLGGFGENVTALVRMRVRERATAARTPRLADSQVLVFPNPANAQVQVKLDLQLPNGPVQMRVTNSVGGVLWQRNLDQADTPFTIETQNWPAGVYFLHTRTREGMLTKQFVIQR